MVVYSYGSTIAFLWNYRTCSVGGSWCWFWVIQVNNESLVISHWWWINRGKHSIMQSSRFVSATLCVALFLCTRTQTHLPSTVPWQHFFALWRADSSHFTKRTTQWNQRWLCTFWMFSDVILPGLASKYTMAVNHPSLIETTLNDQWWLMTAHNNCI